MKANREYKSTLFSTLFNDKDNLRELYNAIADTDYGNETPIEINTLKDVFLKGLKNDISFTIDNKFVILIEHQSTINNNMPLRCLMYIAKVYEKIAKGDAIYEETLQKIPTPEIIVLYNGVKSFPSELIMRLSDAYIATDDSQSKFGSIELTVRVININLGFNDELLQKSKTLNDYTALVDYLNSLNPTKETMLDAVKKTIKWGISQNYLGTFLKKHGAEVNSMLMTEYNLDRHLEIKDEKHRAEMAKLEAKKDAEIAKLTAKKDAEIAKLEALVESLQSEIQVQ